MASKPASTGGTAAIASAAVYIDLPNRRYLLTSVVALTSKQHLTLVSVENARRIVSDAMLCNVGVANAIASRFGTFDGGTCSAKVPVQATPERVGNLLARHRLLLIDLGPPVARVDTIVEGPRRDEIAQLPMSDKVMRVVGAMTELPLSDWTDAFGDAGVEALKSLKEPQTLATLAFVFAIWAFAQTNPAGWAMDAALIGIAVVSLGLGIFGWIRQLEDCLAAIAAIRTPEDEKQAARALLKVLGRLGIDVLITLLTRAAGKAVKARSSDVRSTSTSSSGGGETVSSFNRQRQRPGANGGPPKTDSRTGSLPAHNAVSAQSDVWKLDPFVRGQQIEQALGHNLPGNFPVIDRFENGLATSIKSLNLDAASYESSATLNRILTDYVDKIAGFQGRTWAGVRIRSQDISHRALDLVIPHSGSAAQQAIINQAVNYGASRGITVNVITFP